MIRKMTCIECPKGCQLEVETDGIRLIKVTGNECEKGPDYARQEIEDPRRVVTGTILARGLDLALIPVRTSSSVPKGRVMEVMKRIRELRIERPVSAGDVIVKDILGLGVDLLVTRSSEI
ncbi:MAG: DUF1667 domain-containing protein [Candidatus Margulisiibacteriota bacterium]